jgi:hypothetical protein
MQPKPDQSKKSESQVKAPPTAKQTQAGDVGSQTTPGQKSGQRSASTSSAQTSQQQTSGQTSNQGGGAHELLQHAKQTTSEVVDQVQEQAGSRLNRQKDEAANDLQRLAGAVRRMGDELNGGEQGALGQYAAQYGQKAAEGIERFTNYLRTTDTKHLFSEIENFGRRQPALMIGGAFLLGLAGARFLKSSMPVNQQYTGNALPPPHQPSSHVPTTTAAL